MEDTVKNSPQYNNCAFHTIVPELIKNLSSRQFKQTNGYRYFREAFAEYYHLEDNQELDTRIMSTGPSKAKTSHPPRNFNSEIVEIKQSSKGKEVVSELTPLYNTRYKDNVIPRSLSPRTKGHFGEMAALETLKRAGYRMLPSKLSSGQGFDHVGVLNTYLL